MNTAEKLRPQDLTVHGISGAAAIHWNLDTETLIEMALRNGEGKLTNTGALTCTTGEHTGRSPGDKYIVKDGDTAGKVDWGTVNQAMSPEHFTTLRKDQLQYLTGKTLFVRDAFGGADLEARVAIRVINESAWANLFCRQLFIRPPASALKNHQPKFTIIHTPKFQADPKKHGTRSATFIVINFTEGLILIGGTDYAGEMKKSIFSVLNYLYPLQGIFPMHCSANVSQDGKNSALFFGLSGTGKTTLSADPKRRLIGDDEHGWSSRGVFNFEGGCYAKCINLSREQEPQIWNAIRRGTILENVVLDSEGTPNFADNSLTENTRAAYPLDFIENAVLEGTGGHPQNVIFLTCDAWGVMPPVAKLTREQAMYHFMSGYTAKVAGTEKGMGSSPQTTFSACFGAPFLPLHPSKYAEMLGERLNKLQADCWLVNTGWVGGGFGTGSRIKLGYTRRIIDAILGGELKSATFNTEKIFGLAVPAAIADVPTELLDPSTYWKDKGAYQTQAQDLAARFRKNFEKFPSVSPSIAQAGPAAV